MAQNESRYHISGQNLEWWTDYDYDLATKNYFAHKILNTSWYYCPLGYLLHIPQLALWEIGRNNGRWENSRGACVASSYFFLFFLAWQIWQEDRHADIILVNQSDVKLQHVLQQAGSGIGHDMDAGMTNWMHTYMCWTYQIEHDVVDLNWSYLDLQNPST